MLSVSRGTLFQIFKYIVYVFLAMNVYWFFAEEFLAAALQFPNGVGLRDLIQAYPATIDTAAWVVLLLMFELEVDVRLQEHNRFEGWALRISSAMKIVLYATLLYAAIYWGVKGDFVDFWDAFLWLVAFVFIELNVFEWREEAHEELAAAGQT